MSFVLRIYAHLPFTEARQRPVGVMADLQVWLSDDTRNQQQRVSKQLS